MRETMIASLVMLGVIAIMMIVGAIQLHRNDKWESYEKKGKKYWRRKQ